ncbi:MAG: DUF1844 domain-containing protein [Acidobacteria bacterium]|nr:DUF1844 domain-containing protein [Acidobacteriota bacterium]
MAENRERQGEGFKVFDRRKFTLTGEERTDLPPEEVAPPPPKKEFPRQDTAQTLPKKETVKRDSKQAPGERETRSAWGASADRAGESEEFSAMMASVANTAMVYMEAKDPIAGSQENLAAAKQMIDWLSILQRKTEGNRTPEESLLLENLLYELRMQFLAKSKPPKL